MNNCLKPKQIVLLAVGSFNPPTNMHLRIFGKWDTYDFKLICLYILVGNGS